MDRITWAWMPAFALLQLCATSHLHASENPRKSELSTQSSNSEIPPSPAVTVLPASLTQLETSGDPLLRQGSPEDLPRPISPALGENDGSQDRQVNPFAVGIKLESAPLAANDVPLPINLAAALKLSDARPLIVATAQASVQVAEAQLTRAKVLWLPTLNIGVDYTRHDGGGPDFNGGVLKNQSVNFLYAGAGATGVTSLTDAIYQPLVSKQVLNARQIDIQTAKNDALLQTAEAYFRVHEARGTYAGNLYTVKRGKELVARIEQLSTDLVNRIEIDRARNMLADIQQRAADSRQRWRVQSANLTQVLRLDPRAVIVPNEHDHLQITLIDPTRTLDDLMPIAMFNRPEVASSQAMLQAAEWSVSQEKARPLIPNIRLNGFQTPSELLNGGLFVIGQGSSLNQATTRFDYSVQPMWQLDAIGIGNIARIKAQRGVESQNRIDLMKAQDTVVAEVARAHARLESATARVIQADRALRTGMITFNGNYEGIQQTTRMGSVLVLVNRPQEAVYALQLLDTAFREYFSTVSEYNIAQFELFHALGYPANEVALQIPAGEEMPVDTERPGYLPPVENGPPPATR